VVVAGALIALTPLFVFSLRQAVLLNWTPRPSMLTVRQFFVNTSGGPWLVLPTFLLAVLAVWCPPRNRASPSVALVAWPWLALPPLLLIGYSLHHPLYQYRYLLYCVPALLLLVAATLDKLPWHLGIPVAVALVAAMIPAQLAVRNTSSDPNDSKGEAAVIAAEKRPGDAILFLLPAQRRFINSYPSAYAGLDDVLMAQSQAVTGTFAGTNVDDATLVARLRHVDRVWAVRYFDWWSRRFADAKLAKHRDAELKAAGLRWVRSTHFSGRGEIVLYARRRTG
jgi:mannosyltransferase